MSIQKLVLNSLLIIPLFVFTGLTSSTNVEEIPEWSENVYLQPKAPPYVMEETESYAVLTAYNSLPEQTDDTPHITASGSKTRWGVVACNWLPIDTLIKIPSLFGQKIFRVEDRMHRDNGYPHMDIWMEQYDRAIDFGIQRSEIKIIKVK